MYTSIVVPLDGTAFGKGAIPIAIALALRSDAAVHLVHVDEPIGFPAGGPLHDTRLEADQRDEIRKDLAALAAQLSHETSLHVHATFLDGPLEPTLRQYLVECRHDLVVMMTHARSGLSRAWLGSVGDALVRHTPLPLLLMRPGAEWPGDLVEPLFSVVLVPLDGSAMAEEVLDHVVSLGTPDGTSYTLVTIVVPLPVLPYPDENPGVSVGRSAAGHDHAAALAYLAGVARELRESGAVVKTLVAVHGQMAQGILDVADDQHADLIALASHGPGALARLQHGSVADAVVRGARVPVLVYRPGLLRAP